MKKTLLVCLVLLSAALFSGAILGFRGERLPDGVKFNSIISGMPVYVDTTHFVFSRPKNMTINAKERFRPDREVCESSVGEFYETATTFILCRGRTCIERDKDRYYVALSEEVLGEISR